MTLSAGLLTSRFPWNRHDAASERPSCVVVERGGMQVYCGANAEYFSDADLLYATLVLDHRVDAHRQATPAWLDLTLRQGRLRIAEDCAGFDDVLQSLRRRCALDVQRGAGR